MHSFAHTLFRVIGSLLSILSPIMHRQSRHEMRHYTDNIKVALQNVMLKTLVEPDLLDIFQWDAEIKC